MHSALHQLIKAGKIETDPAPMKIEWARKLINLFKRQMSYTAQIVDFAELFFNGPEDIDEEAKAEMAKDDALPVLKALEKKFADLEVFDTVNILAAIKAVQRKPALRVVNCGCRFGLQLLTKCTDQNCQKAWNYWATNYR